jgi:signal transduction histidine kinase
VARRLAHEIKNPLTPIQLCAERMRRQFSSAPPQARALVEECTTTIVGEVESLKALVDEFAQFARMPTPKAIPSDLTALLTDTLALYNGRAGEGPSGASRLASGRGTRRRTNPASGDQPVDNAVEALEAERAAASEWRSPRLSRPATIPVTTWCV